MIDRRYQKRIAHYLAERERISLQDLEELEVEEWFDHWHMHPDYKFRANRVRPMVALLIYQLLQRAESLVEGRHEPIQAWALLHENTGHSAVYLHSSNPNGTPFPYDFEGVEWGVPEPEEVRGIIKPTHEVGRRTFEGETIFVIRRRIQPFAAGPTAAP